MVTIPKSRPPRKDASLDRCTCGHISLTHGPMGCEGVLGWHDTGQTGAPQPCPCKRKAAEVRE